MKVHRSDFRAVRPTADETADHVDRYGRRPAVARAECVRCGTRIWYSGLAIGSHVRGCTDKRTAPEPVVEFYRRFVSDSIDTADVFVAQAFRSGDGWVDFDFAATKPNIALLRRRGYTAVAFDIHDDSPVGRMFHTADFQMTEVAR